MHLPWSPGLQNDDRLIESLNGFKGKQIVVTEKMDGENATLYRDHYHARSLDSRHHPSRDWIKSFHGSIQYLIPENIRICGENMYAEHSIRYDTLPSYFLGFSVWSISSNCCWSWDETEDLFEQIGIHVVPHLYSGPYDDFAEQFLKGTGIINAPRYSQIQEGYVVRTRHGFHYDQFNRFVAKYVRKDHVQTDQHWMTKPVTPNGLKK